MRLRYTDRARDDLDLAFSDLFLNSTSIEPFECLSESPAAA